jgi:hypothetical protein
MRARERDDQVYSSEGRFGHGPTLDDFFVPLLRYPYLLLLIVELVCLTFLWSSSPKQMAAALDGDRWWIVLAMSAVVVLFSTARLLFLWRGAPVWLRALLSGPTVAVLIYVLFLR